MVTKLFQMIRKEKGVSLIEAALSLIVASVVMTAIQVAIGNVITDAINNNTAQSIKDIMYNIENELLTSCADNNNEPNCDNSIKSIIGKYTHDKLNVDIKKTQSAFDIYLLYRISNNELNDKEQFIKRTAAIYGIKEGDKITSVMGWWSVPLNGTIFKTNNHDGSLYFFSRLRHE